MDGLPLELLGNIGVAVVICYMILTDRLVTKGRLAEARADRDAWRKVVDELVPLVKEQLVYARTADAILRSLPDAAAEVRKGPP